ncbi:MAG TPA: hypothetical protein VM682_05300 [Bacillus sp. (in: firmicutes)]|nr:hypothetical protein [Bacillus sp. (in: firmicutes)]
MTSTYYQIIYDDLLETEPLQPIVIPSTYEEDVDLFKNVKNMYGYLLRSARRKDRLTMLANAYHIGQVLEYRTNSNTERNLCGQILSTYYRTACVQIFKIYESLGLEHLYRSKQARLWTFRKLKKHEVDQLTQEAMLLSIT